MKLKILTEASGSMTAGYIIKSIKDTGHTCVASDIDQHCAGRYLADDFITMPRKDDPALWQTIENLLITNKIDVVIPSFDETLLDWAERKEKFRDAGIHVIISDRDTLAICQDKWNTYNFFIEHGLPTPATSLNQDFPLVKPRCGRGAVGVMTTTEPVNMDGMVSQEYLKGVEYSVDIFCDRTSTPVYIVPRRRINVRDGKSTAGIVEFQQKISEWCAQLCKKMSFLGPINVQCFVLDDSSIKFLEINPRLAGGMALGFAATENWIDLIIDNIMHGRKISPKPIQFGMEMRRYYAEIFIPRH